MKLKNFLFVSAMSAACLCSGSIMAKPVSAAEVSAADVSISVYGEAKREIPAEFATINASLEHASDSQQLCKSQTIEEYKKAKESLTGVGILPEDINVRYSSNRSDVVMGSVVYLTNLDFAVKTKIDLLSSILDTLTTISEVSINNIVYETTNDLYYNELLNKATQNAYEKAGSLVDLNNMVIVDICEQECYNCFTLYKNFVAENFVNDNSNITLKAKVKLTLKNKEV